jgi:chemotaxis protein methyltransferase CheR
MKAHEFNLLRRILKEHSGVNLGEDKKDLVDGKLRPLLTEFEFPSIAHLSLALTKPDANRLRSRVAQAVTVQESYFFRDKVPFNYFIEGMLPKLMARRRSSRRIRVWCAAAATGQEPYSLAMLLAEHERQLAGWTVEIVATDFVEDALCKASKGQYSQFEVQRGLPVSMLVKYFHKVTNGWLIKPELRAKVSFCAHNLLDGCQDFGMFDVIFCRNVLIYFDEALKRDVLARLSEQLASDGYLVLGAAETTNGLSGDFMPVPEGHHGVFCLTPAAAVMARGREAARRRKTGDQAEGPGGEPLSGSGGSRPVGGHAPRSSLLASEIHTIELDNETAGRLEARAKACGLSVAEFVTGDGAASEPWQDSRLTARAG